VFTAKGGENPVKAIYYFKLGETPKVSGGEKEARARR
jgi:hypothetical protein